MKYIAHRGLFNGPEPVFENQPKQILLALSKGYDCEVDLRVEHGDFYLGHDTAQYAVNIEFLETPGLWIHAKNLAAVQHLLKSGLNWFWHQTDDFTITRSGHIWTYPGCEITTQSVMVMPETLDTKLEKSYNVNCYAICSDFVELLRNR